MTGLFDPKKANRLEEEHASGAADHTYRLWTLLSFALGRSVFDG